MQRWPDRGDGARRGPRRLLSGIAAATVVLVAIGISLGLKDGVGQEPLPVGSIDTPYADTNFVKWGARSHWRQPWKAYMDTRQASAMLAAAGINFNVPPEEAEHTARLLAASGIKHARVEIGWGDMNYTNPQVLTTATRNKNILTALKNHGIKPLLLVNSNSGLPTPLIAWKAKLLTPAAQGAKTVTLDPASTAQVVKGRSGLNAVDGRRPAADIIFTNITSAGVATLSKPLPKALPAGTYPASTLKYEPFQPPKLANGAPNPRFQATLNGWLDYVGSVSRFVRDIFGTDDFDVEVWNELSFGSEFLHAGNYFSPPPDGTGDPAAEVLAATVAYLRNPANGVPNVQIGTGFSSQRPSDAPGTSPAGLNALSKHPYKGVQNFPSDQKYDPGTVALDAHGQPAFVEEPQPSGPPLRKDLFVPTYRAFLPEYFLTAIQTEHMVRDLAPFPSTIGPIVHGGNVNTPGGGPLTVWITEFNMDFSGADPSDPANVGAGPIDHLTGADKDYLEAKAVLRSLATYVNKGVSRLDFFAAIGPFGLIDPNFIKASGKGTKPYPGDDAGGITISSTRRFLEPFMTSTPATTPRSLGLQRIDDFAGNKQFEGNGTPPFPPLFDRDVLAFLPFQVTDTRFAVPVYVMTRDIAKIENAGKTDPTKYDLAPAKYRFVVTGVNGDKARASATDPLTTAEVPVDIVERRGDAVTVEMDVTDSPRILTLDDGDEPPPPRASLAVRVLNKKTMLARWKGSSERGIARFALQVRKAAARGKGKRRTKPGPWKTVYNGTKTSRRVRGKRKATYQFRLAAFDTAGVRSRYVTKRVKLVPKKKRRARGR